MKSVDTLIVEFKGKFKGANIDDIEAQKLRLKFGHIDNYDSFLKLTQGINMVSLEFDLSSKYDKSGIGANMEIMKPQDQIDESFDFYPGIAAIKKGYIPCCHHTTV